MTRHRTLVAWLTRRALVPTSGFSYGPRSKPEVSRDLLNLAFRRTRAAPQRNAGADHAAPGQHVRARIFRATTGQTLPDAALAPQGRLEFSRPELAEALLVWPDLVEVEVVDAGIDEFV